jgi:dienelactone hydrolase
MRKYVGLLVKTCISFFILALLTCMPPFGSDPGDEATAAIAARGVKAAAFYDPGQAGPYAVGHASFKFADPSRPCDIGARPIPVEVFYPVDPSSITASTPTAAFPLDPVNNFVVPAYTTSPDWEVFGNDRAYENPPPSSKRPFPLVVFSPGWGTGISVHSYLAGRLATHGFVVAVMYHYGDWWWPWEQFDHIGLAMLNRPKDMSFVLDQMLIKNAKSGDPLKGFINPERVAACGWSLGGYASMVLAAGISSAGEIWTFPGWMDFMGPPPAGTLVPLPPDPRIKALLLLDGSSWAIRFRELARVTIPTMGLGQEWSTLAMDPDPQWASQQARQHAAFQGHPNYRVDISGTNHQSFSNLYETFTVLLRAGLLSEADYEMLKAMYFNVELPSAEANRLTSKYAVAFLKTALAGEAGYQNILTPGYAKTQEHVEFFVTEKRNPNSIQEDWPFSWPSVKTYFMHQPGSTHAKAAKKL